MTEAAPDPGDAELIGESLAILYRFSNTYHPPSTFGRWHFDCATLLENAIMHDAIRFVQSILTILESESASYGLIHADTNLTNWLFQSERVALLDFEVCCYGTDTNYFLTISSAEPAAGTPCSSHPPPPAARH